MYLYLILFHNDSTEKKKPKEEKLEAPKFVKVPEKVEVKENERAQIMCKITGQPRPTGA